MSEAKLVRNKIPQIIRSYGKKPDFRVADVEEYKALLRQKLVEEVDEFLDSEDPQELADILEVLHALAGYLGLTRDALETIRKAKARDRGGFQDRIVWSGNAPTGSARPAAELDGGDTAQAMVQPYTRETTTISSCA